VITAFKLCYQWGSQPAPLHFGVKVLFFISLAQSFLSAPFGLNASELPYCNARIALIVMVHMCICSTQILLPSRTFLRHHVGIHAAARLLMPLVTLVVMTPFSSYAPLRMHHHLDALRIAAMFAGYVLQAAVAPVHKSWEPVIIALQCLCMPCAEHAVVTRGMGLGAATAAAAPTWTAAAVTATVLVGSTTSWVARNIIARACVDKMTAEEMFGDNDRKRKTA